MAPCFSFVFQFVLQLVLFLIGGYHFWFPLFTESIYCTLFLLDCFDFAYGCTCIFHLFNYYLPDFITATCLRFIFGFLFWVFLKISFNAIVKHLCNLLSWPEIKPRAFGVGAVTPRPQTARKLLTLESIKQRELLQRKPLEYNTKYHPSTSSNLCRMPHPNNKQDKNTDPVISRQDHHLTQPCPSEENQTNKQTNKSQHKSHPIRSLHKPLNQPQERRNQKEERFQP